MEALSPQHDNWPTMAATPGHLRTKANAVFVVPIFLARPMVPITDAYDRFSGKNVAGRNLNVLERVTALNIPCSQAFLHVETPGFALLIVIDGPCRERPMAVLGRPPVPRLSNEATPP